MTFTQRLPGEHYDRVIERVVGMFEAEGLDALITDDPEDVSYLTGFFHHPCERPVAAMVRADATVALLVPDLELQHAQDQRTRAELVTYPEYPGLESPFWSLRRQAPDGLGRIGITTSMSLHRLALLQAAFTGPELVPTTLLVRSRAVKFPAEIAQHREAARITDLMLTAGVELVRQVVESGGELPSEAELARHVGSVGVATMYGEHSDVVVISFMAGGLVYTGPNSALPHGLPSGTRLQPGDTFMLSLGAAVGGRFVEGERTFVLGEPTTQQREFHDVVRAAQAAGMRAIAPGVRCADSNAACLGVIEQAGLGRYLRHRQGHGIGLGMHEPPWLESGDATVLEPGMIVSNEPGIYIPGHAGYRISDSMLVTEDGCEPLTHYPRDLDSCTIPA